jgi:diguanylate cyclase (GGDEF)-like protein
MLIALVGLVAQLQWGGPTSGIITLHGPWRFHAGDDLGWAQAGHDDSAWETVTVPRNWALPDGAAERAGFGWYRLRVSFGEAAAAPLALRFLNVATAYEVWVDGARVGGIGGFPPESRARPSVPALYPFPPVSHGAGEHLIAVRVWSGEDFGGIVGPVHLGTLRALETAGHTRDYLFVSTAFLLFGIGFTQLIFWLRRAHAPEHLFIFLFALGLTLFFLCGAPAVRLLLEPTVLWARPYLAFQLVSATAFLYAFRRLFALDEDRITRWIGWYFVVLVPAALLLPEWNQLRVLSRYLINPGLLLCAVVVLVFAIRQLRAGVRHARALLWGTGFLAVVMLHALLANWGVLVTPTAHPWPVLLGTVVFVGSLAMTTAETFADSESAALYDRLTGLYRREVVINALNREIRRSARTRQSLAVIMLDVDRFKPINDTLGHQVGDRVLAEIGRRLGEAGRAVDWLGRYGGEEFIAVLASTTVEGAIQAAERLRSAVAALPIATGRTARTITLSAGVAAYEGEEEWPTTEQLVGAADAALYRAKHAGRDRVCT